MICKYLLHPTRSALKVFFKTNRYREVVDNDVKKALDYQWYVEYGNWFNWERPVTLNEKIIWMEANSDTSLWSRYADKYGVREHLKQMGLSKYLPQIYGIWDRVEDVVFEQLPPKYVIKCTHDCHSAIIVTDKTDIEKVKPKLNRSLNRKFGYATCEPHYTKIKPRIIAEELLEQGNNRSLIDYKFFCINGRVKYCMVCYDRHYIGHVNIATKEIYDINPWQPNHNVMSKEYLKQAFSRHIDKPQRLDEMIDISERLSEGFPFVRIDLYHLPDRVVFGEMTFTAARGRMACFSDEAQIELGSEIVLP